MHKFFLHAMKNRLPDPSEICALEFKGEFRRFKICSVSATNRSGHSPSGDGHFQRRQKLPSFVRNFPAVKIANDVLGREDILARRMFGQPLHAIGLILAAVHQNFVRSPDLGGSLPAGSPASAFQDGQLEGNFQISEQPSPAAFNTLERPEPRNVIKMTPLAQSIVISRRHDG
ncbi:hypothetical protein ABIB06_002567 [Bradyrhizobium sp. LB8.2]|uniref:hypothetical protein n=1 Tax=unclassified Bradyrhizobium TaxID=2631580 RepID=UPI003393042C